LNPGEKIIWQPHMTYVGANAPEADNISVLTLPDHKDQINMNSISNTMAGLELAQVGWVVPDIKAAVKFLAGPLGIAGFPEPQHIRAQDLGMTYQTLGVVTEIMGITPEGWKAIEQMMH